MLTQDQISKLEKLTTHKKYGKLLKAAIPNWKRFKPIDKAFGIEERNGKWLRRKKYPGVCLIGAALYNKPYKPRFDFIESEFNLDKESYYSLLQGFDNEVVDTKTEAYKFAQKVRKIVISVKNDNALVKI